MSTRRFPALTALLLVPVLGSSTGCLDEFLNSLGESSSIVDVFATSHATPDSQGEVPERNGEQLLFANDMGWEIFLDEAYVTTTALSLNACDGERFDVEMYWGALAENIPSHADYEVQGVGGVRATSGSYCSMLVEYGPSEAEGMGDAVGSTVYLAGTAIKADQTIEFVWRTELAVDVDVDLSEVENGEPLHIGTGQTVVNKKLTIAKAYDRFFDGVDFAELDSFSQADVDALLTDTLHRQTAAFLGTAKPN